MIADVCIRSELSLVLEPIQPDARLQIAGTELKGFFVHLHSSLASTHLFLNESRKVVWVRVSRIEPQSRE